MAILKKLPENWFRGIFYFGIVKEDQGLWKILRQSNFASKALDNYIRLQDLETLKSYF